MNVIKNNIAALTIIVNGSEVYSAITPTSREPIGISPKNERLYIDITLPRSSSGTIN